MKKMYLSPDLEIVRLNFEETMYKEVRDSYMEGSGQIIDDDDTGDD